MDRGPQQDPGENLPPPGSSSEQESNLDDLKDQFQQQQVLIAQLKEMLRKTDQSNVTQEKMDRYASTLSKMTARAKKSKLKKEGNVGSSDKGESKVNIDSPAHEKVSMLRKQLEENKARLAERGKNQKGIEEMVSQLKAQFDDSLQLINDTSFNFSLLESKTDYSKESSSEELYNILVIKEKKITDLNCKVQKLEATVLDLQENIKEKDCVIDARTKAITLMTESLSKKGKNTQDALDETKEQMRKMQEDFIKLENEMKARQGKLLDDLRLKNLEIAELQETNQNLQQIQPLPTEHEADMSKSMEEVQRLNTEIEVLLDKIHNLESSNEDLRNINSELEKAQEKLKNNYEEQIRKLHEALGSSKTELEESEKKITELQSIIQGLNSENASGDKKIKDQLDETNQLKKDLEELNKNMIKVKAEHKKKIKVLNKKIETFKKLGDLNAHIVKLSEENDGLREKIAELEEEKGNYQLKMMDSFSKDSLSNENKEELESKIKDLMVSIEEQSKKLNDLESENISLKSQVDSSNENLQKLTELQNEKVTSEITSIQFEELSEKLEKEKNEAITAKENIKIKYEDLLEKVETLDKEKLEVQAKLEQYINENMELMDRLEKLSAEKVSSAESIEIVENLTHQEKLELEEYQKNLDPHSGKLKISVENLEEPQDLNDSVNRLTEETSELMQKIELFTIERREVMEKMESLSNENSQLNLKLKQIENNRDLLTETYEQLQSEKEELDNKIETLEKEKLQLQEDIVTLQNQYDVEEKLELKKKLYDIEGEYLKLGEENENLRKELKVMSEVVHEKDNMELELKQARNKIEELEEKLNENIEEIRTYQSVIDENKGEFIRSATQLNTLNEIIKTKENEIQNHKAEVENLNQAINDFTKTINKLEEQNETYKFNSDKVQILENQLEDLKKSLEENLSQIGDYENELEENSSLMRKLNQELREIQNKNMELQSLLDNRDEERHKEIDHLNARIRELQGIIKEKDDMFHKVSSEMKDKFEYLQKQTDSNSESLEDIREPLQKKIVELTSKNSAMVEKMKKIAANLKKKTQTCQELEQQLHDGQEKWESELKEKDLLLKKTQEQIETLRITVDTYQEEVKQLKHILSRKEQTEIPQRQEVEIKIEKSLQEELSGSFIVPETISSVDTFSKIQELELIIETQENDIRKYKDRINNLEETLAEIDERRETLEQKTNELGVQLEEKSVSFEEISRTEDILEEKLNNLTRNYEEAEKTIEEFSRKNKHLISENEKLKELKEKINQKLTVAQERVNELSEIQQRAVYLDQELQKSHNKINILEQDIRELELEKIQYQESASLDLEKLNHDWQLQFDELSKERVELNASCEKLNIKLSEVTESEQFLNEKINDLEDKLSTSYELQQTADRELSTQRDEMNKLKIILIENNNEIAHYKTELKDFEVLKQNQLKSVAEMNDLQVENNKLKVELGEYVKELNSIKDELEQLRKSKQYDIASEDNKCVIETQSTPENSNPIFTWPGQEEDPFSFALSNQQTNILKEEKQRDNFVSGVESSHPSSTERTAEDNSTEELLQKIRTLEFMLKNVEIERDDVMSQCSYLSNELMRFVFEKDGQSNTEQVVMAQSSQPEIEPSDPVEIFEPSCVKKATYLCYPGEENETKETARHVLESQILPEDFIKDTEITSKELQKIEFTETKHFADILPPCDEELIQRSEAYLCYPESKSEVDSQVLPSNYFEDTQTSQKEIRSLEFDPTESIDTPEKPCHKKDTYLCYPEQSSVDVFGLDDDGWGWNPEEVKLEEKHNEEYEANPFRIKIVELEGKIKNMEEERETKMKEYLELQVKSSKLIKKLKELKLINEKLKQGKKQENSDMFNLDSAIQEELKSQIQVLEKKITEISSEYIKEKNEKTVLEKKIDGLSSMNRRISDLKEKQDVELLMWQRKAEDLKSKLGQLEWGDSPSPEKTLRTTEMSDKASEGDIVRMRNTIAELNESIKELTLDNEDLQALLEEQRSLRINAERSKSVQPIAENMKTESEYLEVVHQKETLENEIHNVISEKKKLQDEVNEVIKRNGEQLEELRKLHELKEHMEKVIEERDQIVKNISTSLKENQSENETLRNQLVEKSKKEFEIPVLLNKISILEEQKRNFDDNESLLIELKEKTNIIDNVIKEKTVISQILAEKEHEIEGIKLDFEKHTTSLKAELQEQIQNTEKLIQENELLSLKQKELEKQIQTLQQHLDEKENQFAVEVQGLNQNWQILVDQRGTDIAESWKLHVESRENEFGLISQQLRNEIHALEEKCKGLVNENNELRNNVDAEIQCEVDRLSALQQQVNERQQSILELSQTVSEKQLQIENSEKQIRDLENMVEVLQKTLEQNDVKVKELNIVIETTQKQFDEKRIIVEAVVKKLEEYSTSPILYDLESITKELGRQLGNLISPEELSQLQKNIADRDCTISTLQNELDSKSEEISLHLSNIQKLNDLELSLREKETSLTEAHNTLKVNIEELEKSQKSIDEYKIALAECESTIKKLNDVLLQKDQELANLAYQLQQTQSLKENENENVQNLQYSLQQYQTQYDELTSNLEEKNSLIDVMNEELEKQQKIHMEREAEVEKLRMYVEELQRSHDADNSQLLKEKCDAIESKNQELLQMKEQLDSALSHVDNLSRVKIAAEESLKYLQFQVQEQLQSIDDLNKQIMYHKNLNDELASKLIEYEFLQTKYEDLQKKYEEEKVLLNEEDKQVGELKAIIEDQVLKIEDFKQKLYEKSNDYDSLIAEMDVRKDDLKTSGQDERPPMGRGQLIGPTTEDELNEWVSRSELDIALYMLHQRDVRCEELTVELTQLLEERDTLQLRLSNAIREKEDLKKLSLEPGNVVDKPIASKEVSPSKGAIPKGRVSEIVLKSTGTELATEAQESFSRETDNVLEHKLTELKNIGYKRDKTLLDEQQQRRLQQISIMQHHMDEASKLPPEAAARLVDANYTLSRDVQSPSKVLLNWLWGRSTPKINEL